MDSKSMGYKLLIDASKLELVDNGDKFSLVIPTTALVCPGQIDQVSLYNAAQLTKLQEQYSKLLMSVIAAKQPLSDDQYQKEISEKLKANDFKRDQQNGGNKSEGNIKNNIYENAQKAVDSPFGVHPSVNNSVSSYSKEQSNRVSSNANPFQKNNIPPPSSSPSNYGPNSNSSAYNIFQSKTSLSNGSQGRPSYSPQSNTFIGQSQANPNSLFGPVNQGNRSKRGSRYSGIS